MNTFPYPRWITRLPDGPGKLREMNRFRLRLAALYAHPDGSLRALARILEVHHETLKSQACVNKRCLATEETKKKIKKLLGSEFLPPDRPTDGDWTYLSR